MNLEQQYEQVLPIIKPTEPATSPLPSLAPYPFLLTVQEDIYKKLRISHELRAETAVSTPSSLLEAPHRNRI